MKPQNIELSPRCGVTCTGNPMTMTLAVRAQLSCGSSKSTGTVMTHMTQETHRGHPTGNLKDGQFTGKEKILPNDWVFNRLSMEKQDPQA